MAEFTKVLQGTDGIRGRTTEDFVLQSSCPLEYYLTEQILTPSFFERYAYAYATLLADRFQTGPGDSVVVGWDPRDPEGNFRNAATNGLRRAGLHVVWIGSIPTPAVPLFMLHNRSAGGLVLTASHNPSDQNGIKLFHGHTALKFLPGDDALLSQTLYRQKGLDLAKIPIRGNLTDRSAEAGKLFVDFCTHPFNSWIENPDFSDTILVVDASKGAAASVVRKVFANFRFHKILFTNMEGDINESCGVADIEGRDTIAVSEVLADNAPFRAYETLTTLFELADRTPETATGALRLVALVFDGDGDRCYRLDYSPTERLFVVSSGDFLGFHLARFIADSPNETKTSPLFVNTVESDLNAANAVRKSGFSTLVTGVGDKWILLQAVTDMIDDRTAGLESENSAIRDCLNEIAASEKPSGFELSLLWKRFAENNPQQTESSPGAFRIGVEESGHCITPGCLSTEKQTTLFFAGNGIKTGLNSLAAMRRIFREGDVEAWHNRLLQPFPIGISQTMYVYYVDKNLIMPGHPFRIRLIKFLESALKRALPLSYRSEPVPFSEESAMIYYKILREGEPAGALFIRNSGTEDKSAIYLRGRRELLPVLREIGNEAFLFLLKNMKSPSNELARLESEILRTVRRGDSVENLAAKHEHLPFQRVLKEMEFKERLLKRQGRTLQLTEIGAALLEAE